MTRWIEDVSELEAHYGAVSAAALRKVSPVLTQSYRRWLEASRFCILSTVGPEGPEGSPRGDDCAVVRVVDERRLWLPDWHGNNRIDSLKNIVRDPRVSLMFLVPGSGNVLRVNGAGRLSCDPAMLNQLERAGKAPRSLLEIEIKEVYFQCARAIMRSRLWSGEDESAALPSAGEMLADVSKGEVGGASYDSGWPERAVGSLW